MKNLHISLLFFPTFILLACSISIVLSISQFQTAPSQCLDDQRSILIELQLGLYHFDQYFNFTSKVDLWDLETDCCSWKGVVCDVLGHVLGLDLSYKNLSGNFQSIFNLHHLRKLNLAGNNFNTSLFLSRFDKLSNLTYLNLSASCFHGQVPLGISYLTRLVSLDLSSQDMCYWRNHQTVDFYDQNVGYVFPPLKLEKPNLETIIKNMKSLTKLYLDSVNISSQSSKWCESISFTLPKLRVLSLSSCELTGPLCSSLSRLEFLSKLNLNDNPISYLPPNFLDIASRLVSLNLGSCNLSGHFPTEMFSLPKMQSIDISNNPNLGGQLPEFPINNTLQVLSLYGTNFSGKLPKSIGNLRFLTYLTIYSCHFSGPIPSSLANLTNLVRLDLKNNNFSGVIPPFHRSGVPNLSYLGLSENWLSGSLPSSIFTLPSLRTLDLSQNQLVGEINEFTNASSSLMEYVNLGFNYLRGSIPMSIFQLPMLEKLYIGFNSFNSMKLEMFLQIKNLRYLDLSNVSLSIGSDNKSLAFPQLEYLWLSSCNLTEFPEFIKTQDKLAVLELSNNKLHGFVPNWLWKRTLIMLILSLNAIDFPEQIPFGDANSSFPMLWWLFVDSCNISTFPAFLKSQEKLQFLDLSNNRISGVVPNWVWKKSLRYLVLSNNHLSYLDQFFSNQSLNSSISSFQRPICNLAQLVGFSASYNNLSGPIPSCLGNINTLSSLELQGNNFSGFLPNFEAAQLWVVKVSDNRLEGKLPRSLANCTQLTVLDVGNNMLYDTFPFWLGELPELKALILKENKFYGQIKDLENKNVFQALDVLDIASNEFSGELSLDFLQSTQLRSLKIGGNKLEGKLPRSLTNCTNLEVLDLGNNIIQDTFPYWLEKLPSLKVLILRANRFYGSIKIFDENEKGFPMLRILDIASNNFSGELSTQFFQCLKAMMVMTNSSNLKPDYIGEQYSQGAVTVEYYEDSVTVVNKGFEMFYQKILTIFSCLDVSNNNFHGIIPEEIKHLRSLKVLNFSFNSFFGPKPLALGDLTDIESLDISQNNLSGKIPLELTSLTFLAVLNLSYNQLEGSIPQSKQFSTFSNDSYQGNPGLCGPPLTRKCNEVDVLLPPQGEDVDSSVDGISVWKMTLIGYGCGLVIGLSVGYTVLNELGNKWLDGFRRNRKRDWRRSW